MRRAMRSRPFSTVKSGASDRSSTTSPPVCIGHEGPSVNKKKASGPDNRLIILCRPPGGISPPPLAPGAPAPALAVRAYRYAPAVTMATHVDPFAPVSLGPVTLRNRIIKAATFEGVTPKRIVTDDLIEYHRRVAVGGVGMT